MAGKQLTFSAQTAEKKYTQRLLLKQDISLSTIFRFTVNRDSVSISLDKGFSFTLTCDSSIELTKEDTSDGWGMCKTKQSAENDITYTLILNKSLGKTIEKGQSFEVQGLELKGTKISEEDEDFKIIPKFSYSCQSLRVKVSEKEPIIRDFTESICLANSELGQGSGLWVSLPSVEQGALFSNSLNLVLMWTDDLVEINTDTKFYLDFPIAGLQLVPEDAMVNDDTKGDIKVSFDADDPEKTKSDNDNWEAASCPNDIVEKTRSGKIKYKRWIIIAKKAAFNTSQIKEYQQLYITSVKCPPGNLSKDYYTNFRLSWKINNGVEENDNPKSFPFLKQNVPSIKEFTTRYSDNFNHKYGETEFIVGPDAENTTLFWNILPAEKHVGFLLLFEILAKDSDDVWKVQNTETSPIYKAFKQQYAKINSWGSIDPQLYNSKPGNLRKFRLSIILQESGKIINSNEILVEYKQVIFVNQKATGGKQDGVCWRTAFSKLQPAIEQALQGREIWIAAGKYAPSLKKHEKHSLQESTPFTITRGIKIYGGFSGAEGKIEQRNSKVNKTILTGELGESDNSNQQYATRIISIHNLPKDQELLIDGLSISNAKGGTTGGGIFLKSEKDGMGAISILNCIFKNNKVSDYGGAIAVCYNPSDLVTSPKKFIIQNCEFLNNNAKGGGAVYFKINIKSATKFYIENAAFYENKATQNGGAILFDRPNGDFNSIQYSIFKLNTAGKEGGAIWSNCINSIDSCLFIKNTAKENGGGIVNRYEGTDVPIESADCIFIANTAKEGGAALIGTPSQGNENSFLFLNSMFLKNHANNGRGGAIKFVMSEKAKVKTITKSVFVNNSSGADNTVGYYVEHMDQSNEQMLIDKSILIDSSSETAPHKVYTEKNNNQVVIKDSIIKGIENSSWYDGKFDVVNSKDVLIFDLFFDQRYNFRTKPVVKTLSGFEFAPLPENYVQYAKSSPPIQANSETVIGFRQIDIQKGKPISFSAKVDNNEVSIETLNKDTHINNAACNFLSLPTENEYGIKMGTCDFSEIDGNQPYTKSITIEYDQPPQIMVWFSALEFPYPEENNRRVRTKVEAITKDGFTLKVETWAGSKMKRGSVSWIAVPADSQKVIIGEINSRYDPNPKPKPTEIAVDNMDFKSIVSPSTLNTDKPTALIGFNYIDASKDTDLKLFADLLKVEKDGMLIQICSWGESWMNFARVAYLVMDKE